MTNPNHTDIVVVLDESGSMYNVTKDMEGGFNALIEDQKKVAGTCTVSLLKFSGARIDWAYKGKDIADVPNLKMRTGGNTPLLDALGRAITTTGKRLKDLEAEKRPGKVVFVIITDGEENCSREYKLRQIKEMVTEQSEKYNWQFLFLGANIDAFAAASSIGIGWGQTMSYHPDSAGIGGTYLAMSNTLASYRGAEGQSLISDWTEEQRKAAMGSTASPPIARNTTTSP